MSAAQQLRNKALTETKGQATVAISAGVGGAGADPSPQAPKLQLVPWPPLSPTHGFARIPTHAVGFVREQRQYPRAALKLPLRLHSVGGVDETEPVRLVTRDISSTGVYFLCPREIPVGSPIELEVLLVERPLGRGNVVMATLAHVQRVEPAATPGWHGIAASFDDVEFDRDDVVPSRFLDL
jgi:hypothetical protein